MLVCEQCVLAREAVDVMLRVVIVVTGSIPVFVLIAAILSAQYEQ
jgi:hypothetical protein